MLEAIFMEIVTFAQSVIIYEAFATEVSTTLTCPLEWAKFYYKYLNPKAYSSLPMMEIVILAISFNICEIVAVEMGMIFDLEA